MKFAKIFVSQVGTVIQTQEYHTQGAAVDFTFPDPSLSAGINLKNMLDRKQSSYKNS